MKENTNQTLVVMGVAVLAAVSLHAVTYSWDGGGTDNNWSTGNNWDPDGSVPVSASNTVVRLEGTNRMSSVQNVANPFVLNRLEIFNGSAVGDTTAFTLSSNPLEFVADGATPPRIYYTRRATSTISAPISIPTGQVLNMDIGTWGVVLTGVISGGGGIDKLEGSGGLSLNNSANTFSGGLIVRAPDNDWFKANVNASGAMGTGPVSLYGGTLSVNRSVPGGLLFYNTTTHTNPISLFKNSPIFAGDLTLSATVSLNGTIDLNANTLYLRGCGVGTINGVISEGAAAAVTKLDTGVWTLSGANTFTGRLAVYNGTVKFGRANALDPAVQISLTNGTADLNGFSQAIRQLSDEGAGGAGVVMSASPATLTINQSQTNRFSGRLSGALSLVKTGSGSLALSNGLSAITGALTVSNGTLVAETATSLGNSTNVTVAGGVLQLLTSAVADTATLRIASGAKVSLAAGLTEFVDKLVLGDVPQMSGTYGAVGSGAQHESAFFDGSGMVVVLTSPVITPADATWDGEGSDLNITTTNNWAGDALPAFDGTTRAIFAVGGSTAAVDTAASFYGLSFNSDTNFVVVNGAGALRIGAGGLSAQTPGATARTHSIAEDLTLGAHQTWNVAKNGAVGTTLSVSGTIDDGYAAYNLTKTGNGVLVLTGSNTYDGVTTVKTGGVVRITSSTAFGSTNGATVVENGGLVEISGDINVAEPIALYGDSSTGHEGVLRSTGGSNTISGLILNGSRLKCFSGSLTLSGGAVGGQFVLSCLSGTTIRVVEKPIQIGGATFFAHADSLVILDVTNNVWAQCEVSGNVLRTDRANALAPAGTLTLGPSTFGAVNLNGNKQTVGALQCTYTTAGTRMVYSTTPATLTVTQNVNTTFNGTLTGAVSVVKLGTGTLTLSKTNTLYGAVAVSNGTLWVSDTGSLGANCPTVAVGGTGRLTLSNSVAIANHASVWMDLGNAAKIELAGGVNESVGYLYIGGVQKRAGRYGSGSSTADIKDSDHFSGTGILTVLRDHFGTVMRVR